MTSVVAVSNTSNGSMYNRHDMLDPAIIANRQAFLQRHDIQMNQATRLEIRFDSTDFCRYKEINETTKGVGMRDDTSIIADALITTHVDHALFLPLADCVGAAIFDPEHAVLAMVHLGRHSLEQNGAHKIISHLVANYGSDPAQLRVHLTPAAGKSEYAIWALNNKGMKEATREQLASGGVRDENIIDTTIETTSSSDYYSYSEFLKGNRTEDGDHAIVAMMTNN